MSWFKLDDQFPTHPKVLRAGPDAAWLFICGGCYCAKHLTNGLIPKVAVPTLTTLRAHARLAAVLVREGLWQDRGEDFEMHDYLTYNPSREQVEEERRQARERRAKGGKRSGDVRANVMNPVPSRPDVLPEQPSGGAVPAPNGTDPQVGEIVAAFVDDWRLVHSDHDPPREFRGACGKAVKSALKNGEARNDIQGCLGVIAKESKNPSALAYVLADMHAGTPRRQYR